MNDAGFLFASILDEAGGCRAIGWDEINNWCNKQGLLWMHLDYRSEKAQDWLTSHSGLEETILEAFIEEETRPRSVLTEKGMLVILRGVNLNPGSDPEDMVSIRGWFEKNRIITVRHRHLMAIEDIKTALEKNMGPKNTGDFLASLCDRISLRMIHVVDDIDNMADEMEVSILQSQNEKLRHELNLLRMQIIRLRRYLSPQRDVLLRLQHEKSDWLQEDHRQQLREVADRTTRYVEALESARERTSILHDNLESSLSERTNKTMYILSVIAAIFLPLGFLTGLLGINIPGIPGAENPAAFFEFCLLLLSVVVFQIILFRWMRWL
nr:zinc transporter ZntB [uncultured Desulfuromonas sp.]